MKVFRAERFLGLRVGRLYVVVKDLRLHRPIFTERNRRGVRYIDLPRHWRLLARWDRRRIGT